MFVRTDWNKGEIMTQKTSREYLFKQKISRCLECREFSKCVVAKAIAEGCIGYKKLRSKVADCELDNTVYRKGEGQS